MVKDFGVRSLLGKVGVKKWGRYIELKTLMDEFMKIGNDYNFLPERAV